MIVLTVCRATIRVMPDDPKSKSSSPMVAVARYSQIGFIIPAAVIVGYFFGRLADYWLHTTWLYLVGLIVGAVIGFVEMIRMATSAFKDKS
jgi:F0F1-type ATP synthase assembly protein I